MKKLILFSIMAFAIQTQAQNVGIGIPTPAEKLDVVGNINLTGTIKADGNGGTAGQFLMKNSSNILQWRKNTIYNFINPPNWQSIGGVGSTFVKIANLGTFTKQELVTSMEIIFSTFLYIGANSGGSNGVHYELRVDDLPTSNGVCRAVMRQQFVDQNATFIGVFSDLAVGLHTISIWAKDQYSVSNDVYFDRGCFETSSLITKEVF